MFDVQRFGAVGDGKTDATASFQEALDAAGAARGGSVSVPPGRYRFEGVLQIPDNVTLRGTFTYAPAHAGLRDGDHQQPPEFGSVLEPAGGHGDENAPPFITINANATLQGFTIHYPEQDPKGPAPVPYPWTIVMRGNNPAALDLQLLNPYKAIDASQNQRALVRNIHGQPIAMGIYVDVIWDIGRIENVHWNPWWSYKTPIYEWQRKHGTAFYFAKSDWHYVLNTFCFGYNVGYHFASSDKGATNGNFLGIGADACHTAILIDETSPMAILITNGEFVAFDGDDPTMVRVTKSHTGTVRFVNCAFWGPARRNAHIEGFGMVGFSDCTFMQWDHKKEGLPSIEVLGGSVSIRGCEFMENKKQIVLGKGVERALVTENMFTGKQRIDSSRKGEVIVKHNLGTPEGRRWKKHYEEAPGFRAHQVRRGNKD